MQGGIEIIGRELIKPSSPTPDHRRKHKLSFLDQFTPVNFADILFFYEAASPADISLHQLKQSLSECLTKFYPLAGKLNSSEGAVDCDDSGALFVEAKVDVSLTQAVHNCPLENFGQYLPFEPHFTSGHGHKIAGIYPRDEILIAVQITRFECGGSAIGVCISHKLADFASLISFMNWWASLNFPGESPTLKKLKQPNFDIGTNLFPPPDDHQVVDFSSLLPLFTDGQGKRKVVMKRFVFDKEKLTELKELAPIEHNSSPTRVEVVTAFLWSHFIKVALQTRRDDQDETISFRFNHFVNLRGRMRGLMASSVDENDEFVFGNLLTFAIAAFTLPDDHTNIDIYRELVRVTGDAIRKVDDDYVQNTWLPLMNSVTSCGTELEVVMKLVTVLNGWFCTSWCRFPTDEVDFGWGKPVSVGPAGAPDTPGITLTSTSYGGIEAWVAMLEDEALLLSDELLCLQVPDYF